MEIQLLDQDGNLKEERQPDPPAPNMVDAAMAAAARQGEVSIQLINEDGNVKDERHAGGEA